VDFHGVIKRWPVSSGEATCETRLAIPAEKATQVALSADGSTVALGCRGKVVVYYVDGRWRGEMIWDLYDDSPLALSADGDFLALGWEFHLRLVDLNASPAWEGERLSRYRCRSLSFSRDGTILAGGGDGSRPFSLWDMHTKRSVGRFVQHGMVTCVAISPDGRWLASADTVRRVFLWDLTKLKRNVFLTDEFAYKLLALSPDNKTVAFGGPDHTLVLWNTETGMTRRFGEHAGRVTDLEFSRDGKLLASSSADRWVRIWNVASGKCIDRHDRHQDEAWSVAFASADGMKLISGGKQGELWWWDRTSGLQKRIPGHRQDVAVWWIKTTSAFRYLVSGSIWPTSGDTSDNEAIVWELKADGPVKLGESLPTLGVCSIALDQKEQYFAMGTSAPTVTIRRFHDRGLEQSLEGGNPWVTGVAISPQEDDDCVLTAGASGEIRIFRNWSEAENAEPVAVIRTDDQFRAIEFFPDGHAFVTAGMDGYIRVWRTPRIPRGAAD
jgi:WD40 repeat protein